MPNHIEDTDAGWTHEGRGVWVPPLAASAQAPVETRGASQLVGTGELVAAGDALAAALQDMRIMLYGLALDARQAGIAQKAIDRAKTATAQWHAAKGPNNGDVERRGQKTL